MRCCTAFECAEAFEIFIWMSQNCFKPWFCRERGRRYQLVFYYVWCYDNFHCLCVWEGTAISSCGVQPCFRVQVMVSNPSLEFRLWYQTVSWSLRCDVISHKLWCLISPWSSSCSVLSHPGVQVVVSDHTLEFRLWCLTTPQSSSCDLLSHPGVQVVVAYHTMEFKLWCLITPWSSSCGVFSHPGVQVVVSYHTLEFKLWCLTAPWSSSCACGAQVVVSNHALESRLWCFEGWSCGVKPRPGVQVVVSVKLRLWCQTTL